MLKSKKIIALTLSLVLALSALSCVVLAAPKDTATLPEGYLVVNSAWESCKDGERFNFVLGGETYSLTYGYTAFATIENALKPYLPSGVDRTIVLAPGLYTSPMTITSNIRLCGPYFGKSPNNKPGTEYFDSSLADWAVANDRSVDPTKEAVVASSISIGTGCNNITIDGIAFIAGGQITDASRKAEAIEVQYNLSNLYFKNTTVATGINLYNPQEVNRYITIDSCRITDSQSIQQLANYRAEKIEIKNSYIANINSSPQNVQLTLYSTPIGSVINPKAMIHNLLDGNRFENVYGCYMLNATANNTDQGRLRVRYEITNNEFINAGLSANGSNANTLQHQIHVGPHELVIKNNSFIMDPSANIGPASVCLRTYALSGGQYAYVDISNNYIRGYDYPIVSDRTELYNVYDNEAYTWEGEYKQISFSGLNLGKLPTKATDLIKYGDAEVLTYRDTHQIHVDLTQSKVSSYVFPKANEIVAGDNVTCTVYADSSMTGTPITQIKLTKKVTQAYLKVEAEDGEVESYVINIYAYPTTTTVVTNKSSQCSILSFDVPEATVVKNGDAYYVTTKNNSRTITPKVVVSDKASYKVYADPECKYEVPNAKSITVSALISRIYIKVTAEDGKTTKVVPVTVKSACKSVKYADAKSIPAYARKAVNYLNDNGYGIFSGDHNKNLNPRNNITRYELAKVMVTLAGINIQSAESINLADIFEDFYDIQGQAPWAIPYVRAAYAAGLITGESDAKGNLYFNGSDFTTREQFTSVFVRAIASAQGVTVDEMYAAVSKEANKSFKGKYADEREISSWARKSVKLATYYGLVNGDGKNFNPTSNIIRADVAVIIYNAVK